MLKSSRLNLEENKLKLWNEYLSCHLTHFVPRFKCFSNIFERNSRKIGGIDNFSVPFGDKCLFGLMLL